MTTKGELIERAFAEIALAAYAFDMEPEERQGALKRMDAMLSQWAAQGVYVGYALSAGIDAQSGIPDWADEAVVLGLAMRLAPGYGKTISADTRMAFKAAFSPLCIRAALPQQQQLRSMPVGAGNKPERETARQWFPEPASSPIGLTTGGDLSIAVE